MVELIYTELHEMQLFQLENALLCSPSTWWVTHDWTF